MNRLAANTDEAVPLRSPAAKLATPLMTGEGSPVLLVLATLIPTIAAAWALLSPARVLSREMSWDLLFNLSGAWHLRHGHVAHVDFHDPVGALSFALTDFGFSIVGVTPHAFLVGAVVITAFLFTTAVVVAWRRFPLLPAATFVVFACLLALMPSNVGDMPTTYSFAMSYNRYGWSAISILSLLLFVPPRNGRVSGWLEAAIATALLIVMYYLKVTYFFAGGAALCLALLVSPHIRGRWLLWMAVGAVAALNAIAPYNHDYLADILNTVAAGAVRDSFLGHLADFFSHADSYAPYLAALILAIWLWRTDRASPGLPAAVAFLLCIGFFLLTQNAQSHGMPLAIVIAFLFIDQLYRRRAALPLIAALLVFPLLSIGASTLSLAGYHRKATCAQCLSVIGATNLQGLAVPLEPAGLLASFADGEAEEYLLNRARAVQSRYELSQYEYVETIQEAAALLNKPRYRPGGVMVLDQVNPLPFMLGWQPARGETLWSGAGMPMQEPEPLFAGTDHVLIPKFSTYSPGTAKARAKYGAYIEAQFPVRSETQSWIVFSRPRAIAEVPVNADAPLSADRLQRRSP